MNFWQAMQRLFQGPRAHDAAWLDQEERRQMQEVRERLDLTKLRQDELRRKLTEIVAEVIVRHSWEKPH